MTAVRDFGELLEGARTGDNASWSVLYDGLAPQVLGYLRSRGASDPDGLLGETFLHVARGIATFDGDEPGFRSWVFTIAHHRLVDERRHFARKPAPARLELVETPADAADVAEEALQSVDPIEGSPWLEVLGDVQRDVVLLRVVAGLSADEVAAIIRKSPGAVRVIQHRALERLRHHLSSADVTK